MIKENIKKVAVIGAGWYGCHLSIFLLNKGVHVTLYEKSKDIFQGSSGYNQYRFHKGFHYPRSKSTINEIKLNSKRFKLKYKNFIKFPKKNYYSVAKEKSLIDFKTYLDILNINKINYKKCKKINFINYENIEGVINSSEGVLQNEKIKKFYKKELKNIIKYKTKIKNSKKLSKEFDLVIDCTNNTLKNYFSKKINYVLTISFIFKSKYSKDLPSLTVMDGNLPSLYKYSDNKNYYTLTHSNYTHIKKFKSFQQLEKYKKIIKLKKINYFRDNSIKSISLYYKNFKKNFLYKGYFFSYKILPNDQSDKRQTFFFKKKNFISFFSPKILNIFTAENIISSILEKK